MYRISVILPLDSVHKLRPNSISGQGECGVVDLIQVKSDIRHQTGGGDLWGDDQSVVEFRDRVVEHEQPE